MSTHYDRLPTLKERVLAAKLVAIGVVQSIKPLPKSRIGEIDEEQAIAQITVEKTLRGASLQREINVRFVASRGDNDRCAPSFAEGHRLVLMAVPDVGAEVSKNTFVAYLGSAFQVNPNGVFTVESESESPKKDRVKERVTIDALRDLVKTIEGEETAHTRSWEKLEPELSRKPTLPLVTEIPEVQPGAGPVSSEPSNSAEVTERPISSKPKSSR